MIYQVGSIRFGIHKSGQKQTQAKSKSRVTIRVREKKAKGEGDQLGNAKPKPATPTVARKTPKKKKVKKSQPPKSVAKKKQRKQTVQKPQVKKSIKNPQVKNSKSILRRDTQKPVQKPSTAESNNGQASENFDFSTDAVQQSLINGGGNIPSLTKPLSSELIKEAKQYGDIIGEGAKVSENSVASYGSPDDGETIYNGDYVAYYNGVRRQFSRKWGGVRLLYGGFVGIPGEMINYNILLDRDGNVIKIVNASAKLKKNKFRDFSAVDALVETVFESMQAKPVPRYIETIPFIIGIGIYYQGTRIFMQYN